jgi:uncharacterized membrane protein YkvI
MIGANPRGSTRFQRWLLPGFAFKAFIIGGGYATGRELAEFFLPAGPRGGLLGMLLAATLWSAICVLTFLLARSARTLDYRSFFRELLGPAWFVFELAYLVLIVLVLAVFGAAAGEIGQRLFGVPVVVGTLALALAIAAVVAYGNASVERLFKWVTVFLYVVYALFLVLALGAFGGRIADALTLDVPTTGWASAGITYAGYNVVGAVVILPVLRHLQSDRDAIVAGALCGPLAMLPALLFFVCMIAFYPQIGAETLPSDFLLARMGHPLFHVLFQLMMFSALLESGAGGVHAINERIAQAWQVRRGVALTRFARLALAAVLLVVAMFLAARFGLVALIARGYRALAWIIIAVYVMPLLTVGAWKLRQRLMAAKAGS